MKADCCNTGIGMFQLNGLGSVERIISSEDAIVASSMATRTATTVSSAMVTPSTTLAATNQTTVFLSASSSPQSSAVNVQASSSPTSEFNIAARAGIGVAAALASLGLVVLMLYLRWWWHRSRRKTKTTLSGDMMFVEMDPAAGEKTELADTRRKREGSGSFKSQEPAEVSSERRPELRAAEAVAELAGYR